ncbi:hypothetical protein WR25_26240 [Diploscapter pachys]|uniref:Protein HID1 n=1 Tax=Diploscapter pachys TaxID=2018661 RepID=A0A2A2JSW6_9BILA|nr:hypothetical protein WR25_26240 [Diploscapter pachys]
MGNQATKSNFKESVLELTSKPNKSGDEASWDALFGPDSAHTANEFFAAIPAEDIRKLRDDSPKNLATLCYKCLEKLQAARDSPSMLNQKRVITAIRILTRIIPYMFEEAEWRGYFWTPVPRGDNQVPLASTLLSVLSDLLFCPGFTVTLLDSNKEKVEDLSSIDSCEYIWEAGVGFGNKPPMNGQHYQNRAEILKLMLTCFSEIIYMPLTDENRLRWVARFTSAENRHVLPLFTSLLNVTCAYDPIGYGLPYNYLLFNDSREPLVEVALQVLIVCLDKESQPKGDETGYAENYFINYLSRIHREEDFDFMLKGITRLLSNPLQSSATYLPNSTKRVNFHQELLVLLWKCCEYNQKFMYYVLKTSDVLEILVPILYHISEARNDSTRVGLIHMGVFLILLLSGERNFGVRLNKAYITKAPIDVPTFTGTHADLLIIVFHKLITTGNYRLQSLFDCLLTIIVNVSPYLKSLSMLAANKLVHLVEAFSTPWFLFSASNNHHLVFFLLEVFNNIIQYQFDGNSNLIYTIIRKRQVFYQLSNLPTDAQSIAKSLSGRKNRSRDDMVDELKSPTAAKAPEIPVQGGVSAGLAATPEVSSMTDNKADFEKTKQVSSEEQSNEWTPTSAWAEAWKVKLPLQTIMRLLQVLVPQVEKICIDKGLTDESEILKFLQHGTLVGLLPVPHPILIRKYQANAGTNHWFRTYMWGVIYLRNTEPPIWYDTDVKMFEIQKIAVSISNFQLLATMPRVAARVEEDPEEIAEREYAKAQAELKLNGTGHSAEGKKSGSGKSSTGKNAVNGNGMVHSKSNDGNNGADIPDDNSDAKSVTSSKSAKSSKSVGKNSTKAEKKLRSRGISGSSSKKDGGRFEMGLDNYDDYEALDNSFDEVDEYVSSNYKDYKEVYGGESDDSEGYTNDTSFVIKDHVYRFLSESVRSPNVPLLGIPDELANLFDETQRVNVIYEAIHQAYIDPKSPFSENSDFERRCALLLSKIVKEGLLSQTAIDNYCSNALAITQPIKLMEYVLRAAGNGNMQDLSNCEYPIELKQLALDLVDGRLEAIQVADELKNLDLPFFNSQFVVDTLMESSYTNNMTTIYNVLGSLRDLTTHKVIEQSSFRVGFQRFLALCPKMSPSKLGICSMANLIVSYSLNDYKMIDDELAAMVPDPDAYVKQVDAKGRL